MKVFAGNPITDYAISRIVEAIKKYAPASIQFVDTEEEAELVIIYAYGQRRKVWWQADRLAKQGKKYAVVQLAIRSTTNPKTEDWFLIWDSAELVWSYYDLIRLINEDHGWVEGGSYSESISFNFYHAPLGVDSDVFKETPSDRVFISNVGQHRNECVKEAYRAAEAVGKPLFDPKGISDYEMALNYSRCKYVLGLRRIEGFEMPVIEGLMCGARPIVFDKPHYRQWFDGLAIFIPEGTREEVTNGLIHIFRQEPQPVLPCVKVLIKERFNWERIIKRFWEALHV